MKKIAVFAKVNGEWRFEGWESNSASVLRQKTWIEKENGKGSFKAVEFNDGRG